MTQRETCSGELTGDWKKTITIEASGERVPVGLRVTIEGERRAPPEDPAARGGRRSGEPLSERTTLTGPGPGARGRGAEGQTRCYCTATVTAGTATVAAATAATSS